MAKNLLSCSPLYLTVIVVCICFVDAHKLGLQKQSTDDVTKGVFISQSAVEQLLILNLKQKIQNTDDANKGVFISQSAVEQLLTENSKLQREMIDIMKMNEKRAQELQSFIMKNDAKYATKEDLKAAIESLKEFVKLLLVEDEKIMKIRQSSSDSKAEEPQSNKTLEILLSTGEWVSLGFTAASLICEFGFVDGLPIVSGMKAVICPWVKLSSKK